MTVSYLPAVPVLIWSASWLALSVLLAPSGSTATAMWSSRNADSIWD